MKRAAGEFFDLEKLSEACAEANRYTFFFTSWPLNMCVVMLSTIFTRH